MRCIGARIRESPPGSTPPSATRVRCSTLAQERGPTSRTIAGFSRSSRVRRCALSVGPTRLPRSPRGRRRFRLTTARSTPQWRASRSTTGSRPRSGWQSCVAWHVDPSSSSRSSLTSFPGGSGSFSPRGSRSSGRDFLRLTRLSARLVVAPASSVFRRRGTASTGSSRRTGGDPRACSTRRCAAPNRCGRCLIPGSRSGLSPASQPRSRPARGMPVRPSTPAAHLRRRATPRHLRTSLSTPSTLPSARRAKSRRHVGGHARESKPRHRRIIAAPDTRHERLERALARRAALQCLWPAADATLSTMAVTEPDRGHDGEWKAEPEAVEQPTAAGSGLAMRGRSRARGREEINDGGNAEADA